MSNVISTVVEFDSCVPLNEGDFCLWWICISTGEWDTYQESLNVAFTKPTKRQLRKAVKEFKRSISK